MNIPVKENNSQFPGCEKMVTVDTMTSRKELSTVSAPMYRQRLMRIEPSSGTIIMLVAIISGLWIVDRLLPVVLVLVAALTLAGTLSPAVRWLEERSIRRGLAIAIVFSALMVVAVLIITLTIPSLMEQVTSLLDQEPALRARLVKWLTGSHLTNPLAELLRKVKSGDLIRLAASNAYEYSSRAIALIAYILSSIFLALYIMIDRDRLRGGLFLIVPRTHHIRLSRVMLSLETIVGGYIRGQIITSALMAVFVFILLKACNVSNALSIAVFSGVADVLPYIGAMLSVGAAVMAALSSGPNIIIIVLVLMLTYETFESRLLIPRIYGRALRLPSSVILFSLLTGSVLMGIVGALLALPVAAALLMLIEDLLIARQSSPVLLCVHALDWRPNESIGKRWDTAQSTRGKPWLSDVFKDHSTYAIRYDWREYSQYFV